MIDWLIEIDKQLFLILNGLNNSFFDFVMYWISSKSIWIPLYIFFIYILYRVYGTRFWQPLLVILVIVSLSDLASVHLFKNVFERLRPCHSPEIQPFVHIVNGKCGGSYGFVSSHAANMFSLATAFWLFVRHKYPKILIPLWIWAAIIGYSRIYLGVHFPADVFFGGFLGINLAVLIYVLLRRIPCFNSFGCRPL